MPKLTDKNVAAIPLTTKGQTITRDKLANFFVRVGRRSRTYTISVETTVLGKRKTMTRKIGDAATMRVSQARNLAMAEIASIKSGKATRAAPEPREEATPVTLGEAWKCYKAMIARKVEDGRRSARTLTGYTDLMERVLADILGRKLAELATREGRAMIADLHREIGNSRGHTIANRAMAMVERVFRHADDYDLAPDLPRKGPCTQVEYFKETRRSTALAPADLPGWNRQRLGLDNPVRQEFHLITLLTGMRPAALKVARWSDLDLKRRVLHVPEPKGGTDKAFDLPLSREIIRSLWRARNAGRFLNRRAAREYIFVAVRGPGHIVETQEKGYKGAPSGFAFGNRLRQTYATLGRLAGVTEVSLMVLMNHAAGDVSRGYVTREAMAAEVLLAQEKISLYIIKGLEA